MSVADGGYNDERLCSSRTNLCLRSCSRREICRLAFAPNGAAFSVAAGEDALESSSREEMVDWEISVYGVIVDTGADSDGGHDVISLLDGSPREGTTGDSSMSNEPLR